MTIWWDVEDESKEVAEAGGDLFSARNTQIAAIADNGERFLNGGDGTEFLKWAMKWEESTLYAHNTRYDLGRVFAEDLDLLNLTQVGSRLIRAEFRNLTFLDSFNLWPMSVAKIGDAVGLPKLKFDSRSVDYVMRDVEIIRKAIRISAEIAGEFGLEKLPATLGGFCVRLWQAMGGGNWYSGDLYYKQGYYGGRVELFAAGGSGEISYCDINSLYPWCMTQAYPDEVETMDRIDKGWGMATVKISIPRQPVCPLPVRREDGSVYYPWGEIDGGREDTPNGTWTFHELRNAVEHHGAKILKVYKACGSRTASYYYRDFVKEFYRRRNETDDEGRRTMFKFLMNNLYGQLAVSGVVSRSLALDKALLIDEDGNPEQDQEGNYLLGRDGWPYGSKILCDIQMPLPEHANYLHAAYVTSYARLRLLEHMRAVPPEHLIYCDTDSLVFFWPRAKPRPFPISRELGEMKLEAEPMAFRCYGPKVYQMNVGGKDAFKAKGIPRKVDEKDPKRRTLPQQFIEDRHAEFMLPFGLREAIVYYDDWKEYGKAGKGVKLSVWHKVEKNLVSEYDKKRLDKRTGLYRPIEHDGF